MARKKRTSLSKTSQSNSLFDRLLSRYRAVDMRLLGMFVVFACVGALAIYRLYHIQVVAGEENKERVNRQHQQIIGGEDMVRGNIYFTYRDGTQLLAATDKEYYQLVINNRNVENPLEVRQALRAHVEYDEADLNRILAKTNDPYEILVPRLDDEEWVKLQNNRPRGIELHSKSERYYPLGEMGSEVLGFVSFQDTNLLGTYGLEKYYDHILRRDGETKDISLIFSLFGQQEESTAVDHSAIEKHIAREGSLITTIEPQMQSYLISELQKIDEKFSSKYSAGVIMNARSGQVVAMGSSQEFDNNTERKHYRNVLVEDRYEFGSIVKPFTVAIGLDTKTIDTDFSYHDKGSMVLNRYPIYNYDRQGRGPYTTLQTILTQSLNTGVAEIALKTGAEQFTHYINMLGFGSETGIDLPYEVYGNTDNIDTGREVELATASFGQGIAVTAIEMVRAWGALANNGVLQTPYVVDLIEYGDLIPARNVPAGGDVQIFTKEAARNVTELLVNVVDESDTFRPYSFPNHSVALKTGTAQLVKPSGGYYSDQFLHSVAGYFPAEADPEEEVYVVMLFTYQPQGARYSSTTLKDAFFNVVGFMINYYELPPDRNISSLQNFE